MINFLLGLFVTSTILLIVFIIKFGNFDIKKKKDSNDYEKLSKEEPDKAIEKSDFFR